MLPVNELYHGNGTVYTYFAPLEAIDSEDQLREIAVWRESWERFGWTCKVLGPSHLSLTPELVRLTRDIEAKRFPSVNVPGYDLHCFLRWVALYGQGGGLMTDYDTVNLGYTPAEHERHIYGHNHVEFCAWRTPAMLYVDSRECLSKLVYGFIHYQHSVNDLAYGRPHVSDMTIIKRMSFEDEPLMPAQAICQELDDQRASCKVVHVSHHAIRNLGWGGPRWQIMRRLMNERQS